MPKFRKSTAVTDRAGVYTVGLLVEKMQWIYREQTVEDYGIDAHVEVVDGEDVTGRVLALQIKSGPSHFVDTADGRGWWFYPDKDDLDYWLSHSLPVIVVRADPDQGQAQWQSVSRTTIELGPKGGRRVLIPADQRFEANAKARLTELADGDAYELRLRQLRLALPWMELLANGERILVEIEEWVNKTSGRGSIELISTDEAGDRRETIGSWGIALGLRSYADAIPPLFPWADVILHAETYGWLDEETPFGGGNGALRPYDNGAGEVDYWRLELTLNDLAIAYLKVDEFGTGDRPFLTPGR